MDNDSVSGPDPGAPSQPPVPPPTRPRRPAWPPLAALACLVGAGVLAAVWYRSSEPRPQSDKPDPGPLDGKLVVIVRPPQQKVDALPVEEPGALPARAGGLMSLEVHLNQPAYSYLVWLDTEGQAVPLYPWNHDAIEVKDLNQPPPARKPTDALTSPPIGRGWTFGKKGGMETVLLLARRTPLGPDVRLGTLLGSVPPTKMRARDEAVVLGINPGADAVQVLSEVNRGPEDEARAAEEPLRAALLRLREHFELIRAVRFAHEGE